MSRGGSSSEPPGPPPATFPIDTSSLVTQLQDEIHSLHRASAMPATVQIIADMERILGHLHTLDDPERLRAWIDTVRTDPAHRHGLTYMEVRDLPRIREVTFAQFPGRDGRLPTEAPLRVTHCIHQRMAEHIYIRYVCYYGGLPHNRGIPMYFAMQLTAEFVYGVDVDYHDRRPGSGLGVGRLQDQDRRPGQLARRPPPALRPTAGVPPELFPITTVRGIGVHLARDFTESIRTVVQQFTASSSGASPMVLPNPTYIYIF